MSANATVASPEKVLRRLFWTLLFRGRAAGQSGAQKTKRQIGIWVAIAAYVFIGFILSINMRSMDLFAFASSLHGITFMFASFTLATSAGSMLFMKEEAEILLHRPVSPSQMLRAKTQVLVGYSLILAFSLNIAGLIVGTWSKGGGYMFLAAHTFMVVLLMTFSAAAIVLVYNACLKWFGRERLDNLLTTTQTLLTIAMIAGSQLLPRFIGKGNMDTSLEHTPWLIALPPVWFGALDAWLIGQLPTATALLPAGLALGGTALTLWLAFGVLGDAYGTGLTALNETQSTSTRPSKPKILSRLVQLPPLSWYLSSNIEKQIFLLTSAYMVRDREVKLKLYPGIIPLLLMPIVVTSTTVGIKDFQTVSYLQTFVSAYLFMVPIQAMALLMRSEHWRAAAIFHSVPLPHWAPLFHGSRKAVLTWLVFPAMLLQNLAVAIIHHSIQPLIMTLPALLLIPVVSRIPGVMEPWLPLSKASDESPNKIGGCLLMLVTVGVASIVGGAASFAYYKGWLTPFLLIEAILCAATTWLFNKIISEKPWPQPGEG